MSLPRWLRLLLWSLLIADFLLLVVVGNQIGFLATFVLLVLSALAGGWLLRHQGLHILNQVTVSLARGELPAAQLLEGVVLVVAAVLLIVPGFLSDVLAIIGLIPLLRRLLVKWLLRRILPLVTPATAEGPAGASRIIEGDFRREE